MLPKSNWNIAHLSFVLFWTFNTLFIFLPISCYLERCVCIEDFSKKINEICSDIPQVFPPCWLHVCSAGDVHPPDTHTHPREAHCKKIQVWRSFTSWNCTLQRTFIESLHWAKHIALKATKHENDHGLEKSESDKI